MAGYREHHVGHPHDHRRSPPTEKTCHHTADSPDHAGNQHSQAGDLEGDPQTVEHQRQDVAPELVGPEGVAPGRVLEKGGSVLELGVVGSAAEGGRDRRRHDNADKDQAHPAVRAVPQRPHQAPPANGRGGDVQLAGRGGCGPEACHVHRFRILGSITA